MTTKPRPPGRWKPGESGNPAGRKPGTSEVGRLRAAIAEHVPAIIAKLTEAALAGDVQAARLLLERTIAPLKSAEQPAPLALPDGTLTDKGVAVLGAVADGTLTPSQGQQVLGAIGVLARVSEVDDLHARVAALEAATGIAPPATPPHGGA